MNARNNNNKKWEYGIKQPSNVYKNTRNENANDAHNKNRPYHLQSAENSSQQQRNGHELLKLSIQSSFHISRFFLFYSSVYR